VIISKHLFLRKLNIIPKTLLKFSFISLCWFLSTDCKPSNQNLLRPDSENIYHTVVNEGEVWFHNSLVQLRFDRELYSGVFLKSRHGKLLSLSHNPPDPNLAKPSHYIVVKEGEILDFFIDYQNIGLSEIQTNYGSGKRLQISGYGKSPRGILIEKVIFVELYNAYPDTAIIWATYRNKDSKKSILVTKIVNNFFRMDASLTNPNADRHNLYYDQNGQHFYGQDSPQLFHLGFHRIISVDSNDFSHVATWNPLIGMILTAQPTNYSLMLPVKVASDQRVEVSFEYMINKVLGPEEVLSSSKGFIMVHSDSYRSAFDRQLKMLNQGS